MEYLELSKQQHKHSGDAFQINGYLKFSFALSKESKSKIIHSNSSLKESKSLIEALNKHTVF